MATQSFRFISDEDGLDIKITKLNDDINIQGKCKIEKDNEIQTFDNFEKVYKKSSVEDGKALMEEDDYDEHPGFTDEEWLDFCRWGHSLEEIITSESATIVFLIAVHRLLRDLPLPAEIRIKDDEFIAPNGIKIQIGPENYLSYDPNEERECFDLLQKLSELRYD